MKAGFWEILLIVILILVLFGHSKIPEVMKNLASGINVFKKELKKDKDEDKKQTPAGGAAPTPKKAAPKNAAGKPAPAPKPSAKPVSAKKAAPKKSAAKKTAAKKPAAKKK